MSAPQSDALESAHCFCIVLDIEYSAFLVNFDRWIWQITNHLDSADLWQEEEEAMCHNIQFSI